MMLTFVCVTTHVLLQRRRFGEMLFAELALERLVACMHLISSYHAESKWIAPVNTNL
jgi:hypothetical protein